MKTPSPSAERVLVVAPHADDAELGCGGSIRRWTEEGKEVRILNLSDTSNINGEEHGKVLRLEAIAAAESVGVTKANVLFAEFPVRNFDSRRQEILDYLIRARESFLPNLVVGPSVGDVHQDHSVVSGEIQRAFKTTTVLGFDTYWNLAIQKPDAVIELSREQIEAKLRALDAYKTQSNRSYMDPDVVLGQARMRGIPRGFEFAEAFSISHAVIDLER